MVPSVCKYSVSVGFIVHTICASFLLRRMTCFFPGGVGALRNAA